MSIFGHKSRKEFYPDLSFVLESIWWDWALHSTPVSWGASLTSIVTLHIWQEIFLGLRVDTLKMIYLNPQTDHKTQRRFSNWTFFLLRLQGIWHFFFYFRDAYLKCISPWREHKVCILWTFHLLEIYFLYKSKGNWVFYGWNSSMFHEVPEARPR